LVNSIWAWDRGEAPPLRLLVEFLLSGYGWLTGDTNELDIEPVGNGIGKLIEVFNWTRTRPPGLSVITTDPLVSPAERMMYFGWVWEPRDAVDVSVATKSDDSEVDLTLWNVGGNGDGMEVARGKIHSWLTRAWVRRMTCQAGHWFSERVYSTAEDRERDRVAILDAIQHAYCSTWWKWEDGSHLLHWRCGPLYGEGKLGMEPAGSTWANPFSSKFSFPPPHTHTPTEEWICKKDKEKLRTLVRKRYLVPGAVMTVVLRFPVKKWVNDSWVVWT